MPVLSDSIEAFIKELMGQSAEVAVQRNELAQHFSCAPSQINYVLSTRFTLERGYIIASRRGGGGYIRIVRVELAPTSLLRQMAASLTERGLTLREGLGMVMRLSQEGIIADTEALLMQSALRGCALPTEALSNAARSNVMRAMVTALIEDA